MMIPTLLGLVAGDSLDYKFVVEILLGLVSFGASTISVGAVVMLLKLNNRMTKAEEWRENYQQETARRLAEEAKAREVALTAVHETIQSKFLERREDRINERSLFEMQLKSLAEKHAQETEFLKNQLVEIKEAQNLTHRRLDEILKNCAERNGCKGATS